MDDLVAVEKLVCLVSMMCIEIRPLSVHIANVAVGICSCIFHTVQGLGHMLVEQDHTPHITTTGQ